VGGLRTGRRSAIVPVVGGTGDPKITKNNTNEASMLLKTNDAFRKRTQNELRIDCTMRALNTEFELFDASCVPASVWGAGLRPGWRFPGWRRRHQPQRGVLTQPRPTAWVNEAVPLRFAKALKGRDQFSGRASQAVSREAYCALSGLNANCTTGSRPQAVGLGCGGAAPLGLSAVPAPHSGIEETKRECL